MPPSELLPNFIFDSFLDIAVEDQLISDGVALVKAVGKVQVDEDGIGGGVVVEGDLHGVGVAVVVKSVGGQTAGLSGGVVGIGKVHALNLFHAVLAVGLNHAHDDYLVGERKMGIGGVEVQTEVQLEAGAHDAVPAAAARDKHGVEEIEGEGPVGANQVGSALHHHVIVLESVGVVVDGADVFFLASGHAEEHSGSD